MNDARDGRTGSSRGDSTLRHSIATAALACFFFLSPSASAAIIVGTTDNFSSSSNDPDVYVLDDAGGFESYFFSPFRIGDLTWSARESLLVGHESTGTIAEVDTTGGLINLFYTPADGISGLAQGSDGRLYVSEDNSNRLFTLDQAGNVEDITFMPTTITALDITLDGELVFVRSTGTSSFDPKEVVFWDPDLGEISSFSIDLRYTFGIAVQDETIMVIGGSSSSSSATQLINTYSMDGTVLGSVNGPRNARTITAHTPEPGTALLIGAGLVGLGLRGRRSGA